LIVRFCIVVESTFMILDLSAITFLTLVGISI
jgi:hypothetical protein